MDSQRADADEEDEQDEEGEGSGGVRGAMASQSSIAMGTDTKRAAAEEKKEEEEGGARGARRCNARRAQHRGATPTSLVHRSSLRGAVALRCGDPRPWGLGWERPLPRTARGARRRAEHDCLLSGARAHIRSVGGENCAGPALIGTALAQVRWEFAVVIIAAVRTERKRDRIFSWVLPNCVFSWSPQDGFGKQGRISGCAQRVFVDRSI